MKNIFFRVNLIVVFSFFIFGSFFPGQVLAINGAESFKAKVTEIIEEQEKKREDNSSFKQQNLRLEAIEGEKKGEEFIYYGISDIEVADSQSYKVNDRVFVDIFLDENDQEIVYVTDFIRSRPLFILAFLFVAAIIIIGRSKGARALISLILTFVVIIKFILPQILAGRDPFLITLIGGLFIMMLVVYITEGWRKKSHLAILSILISLSLTLLLSVIFTNICRLTGMSQEEAVFLISSTQTEINFHGLLLAGILIGAIGVLDDIIISQIEAVERIKEANPKLSPKRVFSLAYKIGNTHLGTMVNTLFLTYTGAALPLLLIFSLNQEIGLSLSRALNNEMITTEIVRTLVGSIGIMASMPIATLLASLSLKKWTKG
jgi:uncharacterized membrane protein